MGFPPNTETGRVLASRVKGDASVSLNHLARRLSEGKPMWIVELALRRPLSVAVMALGAGVEKPGMVNS